MKFFLDTASLKDISWAAQAGLIDGITTNPSLLSKQAGDLDPRDVLKEICSLLEGPVSAEGVAVRSEEHTSELQSLAYLVCRLLLEKKKNNINRSVSLRVMTLTSESFAVQ